MIDDTKVLDGSHSVVADGWHTESILDGVTSIVWLLFIMMLLPSETGHEYK